MADLIEEPNVTFSELMEGETYFMLLQKIAVAINTSIAGYNVQIQAGEDAATALTNCQAALQANLEASATHLPLQSGQANKILKSQGQGGQAFWGGDWEIKTESFQLTQLDSKITLATATDIDVALKIPEVVGMHVLLHNSLQSTEAVKIVNPLGTIIGLNETWLPGQNIIINPGETFQAFCTDLTPAAPVWELF